MNLPSITEYRGQRVLTTRQIAEAYETSRASISNNYTRNKCRYIEGKHIITLRGDELKYFKGCHQIDDTLRSTSILYLWTEKGALLHAKSLNTDKAWEVYDYLVDFYFRAKKPEYMPEPVKTTETYSKGLVLDIPNNREVQKKIKQIKDYCISAMTLLDMQNKYLEEEKVRNIQESIKAIGAYIFIETTDLMKIKVKKVKI